MTYSQFQRDWDAVGGRIAVASAAVTAIDEMLRVLTYQRKAAEALRRQRLSEHTEFILAHQAEISAHREAQRQARMAPQRSQEPDSGPESPDLVSDCTERRAEGSA